MIKSKEPSGSLLVHQHLRLQNHIIMLNYPSYIILVIEYFFDFSCLTLSVELVLYRNILWEF